MSQPQKNSPIGSPRQPQAPVLTEIIDALTERLNHVQLRYEREVGTSLMSTESARWMKGYLEDIETELLVLTQRLEEVWASYGIRYTSPILDKAASLRKRQKRA